MTRCQSGDTAYFRKGPQANVGMFVHVVRVGDPGLARTVQWGDRGVYWLVEASRAIMWPCGHAHGRQQGSVFIDIVPDDVLTPVRDLPGEDETLTWKDVPRHDEVPA